MPVVFNSDTDWDGVDKLEPPWGYFLLGGWWGERKLCEHFGLYTMYSVLAILLSFSAVSFPFIVDDVHMWTWIIHGFLTPNSNGCMGSMAATMRSQDSMMWLLLVSPLFLGQQAYWTGLLLLILTEVVINFTTMRVASLDMSEVVSAPQSETPQWVICDQSPTHFWPQQEVNFDVFGAPYRNSIVH